MVLLAEGLVVAWEEVSGSCYVEGLGSLPGWVSVLGESSWRMVWGSGTAQVCGEERFVEWWYPRAGCRSTKGNFCIALHVCWPAARR
jgi:hypothetical protein